MVELSRAWIEQKHSMQKLVSTICIMFALGAARTFGEYVHSVYDGQLDYAVYKWRGKKWTIPTGPQER